MRKYLSRSKVKVKCHQYLITSGVHRSTCYMSSFSVAVRTGTHTCTLTHAYARKQTPLKTTPALPAWMETQVIIMRLFLQRKTNSSSDALAAIQTKSHGDSLQGDGRAQSEDLLADCSTQQHQRPQTDVCSSSLVFTSLPSYIIYRIYIYIFTFQSFGLLFLPTLANLTDEICV